MPNDLLSRLRAVENGGNPNSVTHWHRNPDGHEAADRIEQLEAALRSIAEKCKEAYGSNDLVQERVLDRIEEIAVEAIAVKSSGDAT